MFNISDLINRSWKILWRYRVLWFFALLLALTGGAGGGGGSGGGGSSSTANLPSAGEEWFNGDPGSWFEQGDMPAWMQEAVTWFEETIVPRVSTEADAIRFGLAVVGIVVAISLVTSLLLALVRYPSETAVMRLVDDHEHTGSRQSFKQGWKLGWDKRAWKLFLVDLLIGTPAFAIVMLLVGLIVIMILNMAETSLDTLPAPVILAIVFIALFFVVFALFMSLVSLLRQYVARFVTLEGTGVGEAFKRGWQFFTSRFWGTVVLGLVQMGLGIAFGFGAIIAFFLLIPAYAVMAIPGAVVAALPGGLAYLLANISLPAAVAVAVGLLVAIPIFFIITFTPLSFLSGMFAVFTSNMWTLAFRTLTPFGSPLPVSGDVPPALPIETPLEERIE